MVEVAAILDRDRRRVVITAEGDGHRATFLMSSNPEDVPACPKWARAAFEAWIAGVAAEALFDELERIEAIAAGAQTGADRPTRKRSK